MYLGTVLECREKLPRYRIHYAGFGARFDEWIDLPRMFDVTTPSKQLAASLVAKPRWQGGKVKVNGCIRVGDQYQAEIPPWNEAKRI